MSSKTITIGRKSGNDIVITDSEGNVSRHHADLRIEADNVYLTDCSTNGTWINDHRIPPNSEVRISAQDKIMLAKTKALHWSEIKRFIPVSVNPKANGKKGDKNGENGIKPKSSSNTLVFGLFGFLFLVGVGIWFLANFNPQPEPPLPDPEPVPEPEPLRAGCLPDTATYKLENIIDCYNKSVVIIFHLYYYSIDYQGERLYVGMSGGNMVANADKNSLEPMAATGTGFFISEDGKLITNRHVAFPWKDDQKVQAFIDANLPGADFEGETVFMSVAVNGTAYSSSRSVLSFDECRPIRFHSDEKVDMALVKMKSGRLLNGTYAIDIERKMLRNSESTRQGSDAFSIGFPGGFDHAVTDYTVNSSSHEGTVQQDPGDYILKCNMNSAVGASGSPVFNDKGQVIGILTLGLGTNLDNYIGCMHAKFIRDFL